MSASGRYASAPAARATVGPTLPVGKCLNYAGQLEVAVDHGWMRPVVDADFAAMRAKGFQTLRLPLNFSRFAGTSAPYPIDPAYMTRVKRVVDLAKAAGMNVIIDNHANKDFIAGWPANQDRFLAIWRQVAQYFANEPSSVWFEILNEPRRPMLNADLNVLYPKALAIVRETNPTRIVILGGEHSSGVWSMQGLVLPNDPNIVVTIHYYDPLEFSHQGAPFVKPTFPAGVSWGSASQYQQLDNNLAVVTAWMKKTGRVPFVGEYGAYEGTAMAHRVKYYDDVSHAFASIGVQSCVWGYVNDFPIRTWSNWHDDLIQAMATTTTL